MIKKVSSIFLLITIVTVFSILVQPAMPASAQESEAEFWAVIVGVAKYQAYWIEDLDGFDANARDLSRLLSPAWGEDHIKLLTNSEATKENVQQAVDWLASSEDSNDIVLFYFAGHGISEYVAPHDADYDLDTFISTAELKSWLGVLDSENIIIIMDACNTGSFNTALSDGQRVILMSSQADEKSYTAEFGDSRSGLFSYYILEALNGAEAADANNDYIISAEEIFQYAELKTIPPTIQWYADGLVTNVQHPLLSDRYTGELGLLEKFVFKTEPDLLSVPVTLVLDNEIYSLVPLELLGAPGSVHQLEISPVYTGAGARYIFTSWNDGNTSVTRTFSRGGVYTANYKTQYQLTIESAYGEPEGEGWYDSGAKATISVTSIEEPATRHIFTGWSGDFTGTTPTITLTMNSPVTVTANWRTDYPLTIETAYGQPTGEGWYESGATATISVTSPEGTIIRQVFTGWGGDFSGDAATASLSVNSPVAVTANWRTDYTQLFILIAGIVVLVGAITIIVRTRQRKNSQGSPS